MRVTVLDAILKSLAGLVLAVALVALGLVLLVSCSGTPSPYPVRARVQIVQHDNPHGVLRLITPTDVSSLTVQAGRLPEPILELSSDQLSFTARFEPFIGPAVSTTCAAEVPPPPRYWLMFRLDIWPDRLACAVVPVVSG